MADSQYAVRKRETTSQCGSFQRDDEGKLVRCMNQGIPRVDNGLPSGTHCNGCWEKLVYESRQRSW